VIYIKRHKAKIKLELPDIKCVNDKLNIIDASIDHKRPLSDRNGDFFCFCKINELKLETLKFPDGQMYCQSWKKNMDAAKREL